MAYIYPFRMTSTTATLLLIDPVTKEVIIGVRSDNAWVYPNADSLPGGFMEARFTEEQGSKVAELRAMVIKFLGWKAVADEFHDGEDSQDCAIREAMEELSIALEREQLVLFNCRANSRTDTRAHVTNVCYYAELTPEQSASLDAGDDLKEIKRWKIDDLFLEIANIEQLYPMAFNHFEVMMEGLAFYKKNKHYEELKAEVMRLRIENAEMAAELDGDISEYRL